MADNLESYFKKHLSDETPGQGDWNVPSDDVWNKVSPEITKKRGLFISWKSIYIFGALVVAVLAIMLWPSDTPQGISDTNDQLTTENYEPPINENLNTSTEHLQQPSSIVDDQPAQISNNLPQGNTPALKQTPAKNVELNSNNDNIIYSEVHFTESSREDPSINILPKLGINIIEIPSPRIILDTTPTIYPGNSFKKTKPKPKPFNNKNKIAVGGYFAPTYNSTYVSGDLSSGQVETANTFLYSSNWGIELKYFISNRFALVTGYERSEIKSWSRSLIDFDYDISTEHTMPEGDKENISAVPMQTPFGEIGTEITYRFSSDQSISDGESMQSAMETHQDILYFAIPLGVEYNIMQFSRLNWFGEGGIRYHRALNDGTSYTSRILHEGHDMNVVNEVMTGHPNYTKNYLSFYIGSGVNWQFSESFQISGSARYFGNITKVNFQDNLSTYVHGFNLKLGFIYIF